MGIGVCRECGFIERDMPGGTLTMACGRCECFSVVWMFWAWCVVIEEEW